jgi:hypothetical protein
MIPVKNKTRHQIKCKIRYEAQLDQNSDWYAACELVKQVENLVQIQVLDQVWYKIGRIMH